MQALESRIKTLMQDLEPHSVYKQFHDFLEENKLKQKDYRAGSVKGVTVKYNIKLYKELAKILESVDDELAASWEDTMRRFESIHAKITQHGAAFTEKELKVLQREIKEFIATYCQFVDDFGPDSDSKERGELCVGIKMHYLLHVVDYIRLDGGLRPSFLNEERIEHMVQSCSKTLRPYRHLRGAKRLFCAMRQLNLRALFHAFYNVSI